MPKTEVLVTCSFIVFSPCTANSAASQQALHSNLKSRKLLWPNSCPKNSRPPKSNSLMTGCCMTRPHNLSQHKRVLHKCRNTWKGSRKGPNISGSSVRLNICQTTTSAWFIVDYLVSLNIRKGSWEMQNETIILEEAAIQQNRLDMNSKIHLWM